MCIMTHAKFHFNQLMLTLIFGIRASERRPGERLKGRISKFIKLYVFFNAEVYGRKPTDLIDGTFLPCE